MLPIDCLWAVSPVHFQAVLFQYQQLLARASASLPTPVVKVQTEVVPARNGANIAVVPLQGLLTKGYSWFGTSTVAIRNQIRTAAADPNISAILLNIDSPGGTAAGTYDLATDVRAAAKQKPVWAHVSDLGASAAYWIASQADQVFANAPTAQIGSIGTVIAVPDMSEAAAKEGVKIHVFATGPLKGTGIPGTKITDEQAAHLQSLVNEIQTHFDSGVKSGRGMTANQLANVKTGGVFSAAEAVRLKLVDGVQSLDKTLAALAKAR